MRKLILPLLLGSIFATPNATVLAQTPYDSIIPPGTRGNPASPFSEDAPNAFSPDKSGIPVVDIANLIQNILHYVERLYEITQKAIVIQQNYTQLTYWYQTLLNLDNYPHRASIIDFLHGVYESMRSFENLRGQYQALTYALHEVGSEFDLTLPGWTAYTDLSMDSPYHIDSLAGAYTFEAPMDFKRYQYGRIRQALRQSLGATSKHRHDIRQSEEHLAVGSASLNALAEGTAGLQQILEMQTAYAALTAQQLVAMRSQIQTLNGVQIAAASHQLNKDMQNLATLEGQHRILAERLRADWGNLLPNPTVHPVDSPFPTWIEP